MARTEQFHDTHHKCI